MKSLELGLVDEEIAFTVPVEAYEHYTDWIGKVAGESGLSRYRFIDEPSAAALGYGAHVQPGNVYCLFDFGGGTLDVAVVLIEEEAQAMAGEFLISAGYRIGEYRQAAQFDYDDDAKTFLEREVGLEQAIPR